MTAPVGLSLETARILFEVGGRARRNGDVELATTVGRMLDRHLAPNPLFAALVIDTLASDAARRGGEYHSARQAYQLDGARLAHHVQWIDLGPIMPWGCA